MREIIFSGKGHSALVFSDKEKMGRFAAKLVLTAIQENPCLRLGLATGSTPLPLYACLVEACQKGEVSFSKVKTYNLDEYYPIDPSSDQSYISFMEKNLFHAIDLPRENVHIPNGGAPDGEEEAARYRKVMERAGGLDVQILGIGSDGHIGFNEPSTFFPYHAHTVELTKETIADNARFFSSENEVPRKAITMGIGCIMRAKTCILMATGKNKAKAVRDALVCDPSPACPASVLQFHPDTVWLLDEEAASLLD